MDRESFKADRPQEIVHDEHGLGVGRNTAGADRIEIALHELAVAAALRVLAPPYGGNVVALEWRAERADVLCGKAGQGHGEIESQTDIATAMVLETIQLLVRLR